MSIFKYYNPKHEKSILQKGSLNIGTISYFRKIEDKVRQDYRDGSYTFLFIPENEDIILTSDEVNSMSSIVSLKDGVNLHIKKNAFLTLHLIVPDAYVFCTSMTLNQELKDRFGEGVIKINNIKMFGDRLFRIISQNNP